MKKELGTKQKELNSYLDALEKSRQEHDSLLLGALNYKIDQIISQIATLEEKAANCGESQETAKVEGFSSVKSEEGQFATKSCGELRKMMVQVIRRVNALQRRENSLLSELTTSEKSELKDARQDLDKIRKILNTRCAVARPPDSLKQRLR